MAEITVKQLKSYLYLLDDNSEATGYLLVGDEKACLIDTMVCGEDLYALVRRYTDKPIMVVNTHGHPDHIYGNVFFDKAYMNLKDLDIAKSHMEHPEFVDWCEKNNKFMPPFEDIHEGDVIDLGNRTLEVYDLPGHTPGGIMLLFKQDRILFTGDSINHHLWMQLPECSDMKTFAENLERVMFLENEADVILHGHAKDYDDISLMRSLYIGAMEICEGKTQDDKPYKWFGGEDLQHSFNVPADKHFQQDDHVICYRK